MAIEDVVHEVKAKRAGPGRPKGRRDSVPRRKAGVARRAGAEPEHDEDEREPYVPTEEGIAISAVLGNTIWNLSRMFTKHGALTAEQQHDLGAAIDPVMYKYLPLLDDFRAEATLVMVVWTIWNATTPPKKGSTDGDAREQDAGNGVGRDVRQTMSRGLALEPADGLSEM